MHAAAVRFGSFTLIPAQQRLLRHGDPVPLGSRALQMLTALVQRPGELVTKDELLDTVWRGLVVEEANLHVQVSLLRKAVGADAVVTVPGQGYRFALPVAAAEPADGTAPVGRPRRLSVIVLPFAETGAPPDQQWFADAITDDVTTQLSRIRGAFVVGSTTAMALRSARPDMAALARELGVRHVLQGRLERMAQSVEANVRLTDATTGAVAWSDVIEVQRDSLPMLRRELVTRLAVALDLQLVAAEARRSAAEIHVAPEADDLVMQARAAGGGAWTRERMQHAVALCDRALVLAPGHAQALAWRAHYTITRTVTWPEGDVEAQIAQAERDVTAALAQEPLMASCHLTLARVRMQQFRLDAALTAVAQSLELNANDPRAWNYQGEMLVTAIQQQRGLESVHRALEISPRDALRGVYLHNIGRAHLMMGQYELAAVWCQKSLDLTPSGSTARLLAAALAHLGRIDEAQVVLQRAAGLWRPPSVDAAGRPIFSRGTRDERFIALVREHLVQGLLKAGDTTALATHEAWAAFLRSSRI